MAEITAKDLVAELEKLDAANQRVANELSAVIAEARAMVDGGSEPPSVDPEPPPSGSSDYVDFRPLKIDSADASDIVKPKVNPITSNTFTPAGGSIIDLRGEKVWHRRENQGVVTPFVCRSTGANAVFTGGTVDCDNENYQQMTWKEAHGHAKWNNAPGLRLDGITGDGWFQGFDLQWCMDAIIPSATIKTSQTMHLEAIRIINCKDDCLQKDGGAGITNIYNCFFQGHVGISRRPGAEAGAGSKAKFTIAKSLFWQKRQPYSTDEKGTDVGHPGSKRKGPYISPSDHSNEAVIGGANRGFAAKWFFKSQGAGANQTLMDLDITDSIFRIDTIPVEGPKPSIFPTDGKYDGLTVVWLGGGKWDAIFPQSRAELAKLGIEVLDDEEVGYERWMKAEVNWYAANGYQKDSGFKWTRT